MFPPRAEESIVNSATALFSLEPVSSKRSAGMLPVFDIRPQRGARRRKETLLSSRANAPRYENGRSINRIRPAYAGRHDGCRQQDEFLSIMFPATCRGVVPPLQDEDGSRDPASDPVAAGERILFIDLVSLV